MNLFGSEKKYIYFFLINSTYVCVCMHIYIYKKKEKKIWVQCNEVDISMEDCGEDKTRRAPRYGLFLLFSSLPFRLSHLILFFLSLQNPLHHFHPPSHFKFSLSLETFFLLCQKVFMNINNY